MNKTYLCLGSNLGNKEENINTAIILLKKELNITKTSALYKTEPTNYENQDFFLNQVIEVETNLTIEQLFTFTSQLEQTLGKDIKVRFGPRTIDIDILFYNDEIINTEFVQIPHPRLHERKFVLIPLSEIAPNLIHPIIKKNIKELLNCLENDTKMVEKWG
jgi:2-amino-4-hydroxy-6-hydroxymethyldihydropteridine diphosphokinase